MSARRVPLGELCEMDRRGIQPDDPLTAELPFVGVENVVGGTGLLNFDTDSRIGGQKSTAFRFDRRHVLYGKLRPYLNKVAVPEFAGRCSTELVPLLPRNGVDRAFLAHLLRRKETIEFVMASVTGSRMPRTDMKILMSMPVPLPTLDEQRRIASILNRAARIECLRARIADHLREFIPALFIKMFGEPIENPMRWKTTHLGDLISKGPQNGLYRPKSDYGSGTRILRIDGFYGGRVADPLIWQRVRLDDNTVRKYALAEDDIVINRVNSRPLLGKSAILPRIDEPAVFESNMMRLTANSDRILPKLLIAMLQIESIRQRLRLNAKDAINQSSINQSDVRELPVIVPPLALQTQFAAVTAAARNIAAAETASNTSSTLKASLVSRLLDDFA